MRDLTEVDLDTLCQWRNQPDVCRFLANRVKTPDQDRAWFERIKADPKSLLKGILADGRLVGYCIVEDVDDLNGKCQIGVIVGDPDLWGKGIGRTVVRFLLEHCFVRLRLHRVLAVVARDNVRSEALFHNAGFVHEGTLREATLIDGKHTDLLCYSMLSREYDQKGSNKPDARDGL